MKRVLSVGLALLLAASTATFAKSTPAKKGFEATKKEKIRKLEYKLQTIQNRLSCIKKAKDAKAVKACEKKYPLVKRGAKKMGMKKKTKSAKKSK